MENSWGGGGGLGTLESRTVAVRCGWEKEEVKRKGVRPYSRKVFDARGMLGSEKEGGNNAEGVPSRGREILKITWGEKKKNKVSAGRSGERDLLQRSQNTRFGKRKKKDLGGRVFRGGKCPEQRVGEAGLAQSH